MPNPGRRSSKRSANAWPGKNPAHSTRLLSSTPMNKCHDCGRFSAEGALFCGTCRSSFSVKLCSKLHANPVHVKYCLVCGSEELSRPHRRPYGNRRGVFLWLPAFVFLASGVAQLIRSFLLSHRRTPEFTPKKPAQ